MAKRQQIVLRDEILPQDVVDTILKTSGATPLEVMVNTMQMLYSGAQAAIRELQGTVGPEREYLMELARLRATNACALAKEIAPYIHRKQPLAVETRDLTDEDKQRMAETVREVESVLAQHQRTKRQTKSSLVQ